MWMFFFAQYSINSLLWRTGWRSIWFTVGTTPDLLMMASSCGRQVNTELLMVLGEPYTYMLDHVVRHTHGAGLGLGKLGHGLPGIDDGDVVFDLAVAALDSAALNEGEVLVAGRESHRPVDEVELGTLVLVRSLSIVN